MKKVLFLVVAAVISLSAVAQQLQEVVYLKNGSVIRGTIIEQVPSESLKIQTADGCIFVYSMAEIAKMSKEPAFPVQKQWTQMKQGDHLKKYSRISLSYNLLNVKTKGVESLSYNGVAAGWTMGVSLMKTDPLYFEFGANMMWGFGKDEEDWYENKLSLLSFNVPLALTYQFSLGEKVKIAPYAGLNLCVHLKGEVDEVDMFGSDYDEGDGDRFNVGGLAGINFTYGKLVLGVGYMLNFTEILQETKLKYPAFSIGIQF